MDLDHAAMVAAQIALSLAPACERLEIAGSIRRRKEMDIHDVELVAIPRKARIEFGQAPALSQLHALTDELRGQGRMIPRHNVKGHQLAWGPKWRSATWTNPDGMSGATALDLFITTPEQWGVCFLLRTGDAEFNKALVTPRQKGGVLPKGFRIDENRLWKNDVALPTPEEGDVFDALGLPWITPAARTGRRLQMEDVRPLARA